MTLDDPSGLLTRTIALPTPATFMTEPPAYRVYEPGDTGRYSSNRDRSLMMWFSAPESQITLSRRGKSAAEKADDDDDEPAVDATNDDEVMLDESDSAAATAAILADDDCLSDFDDLSLDDLG